MFIDVRAVLYNRRAHAATNADQGPNPKLQAPGKSQASIFKPGGIEIGICDLGFQELSVLPRVIDAISVSHG